jgi:predicted thioesterase
MAKPKVYVETTVISYLTAWPSRDLVVAAHQQITRDWWANRDPFELVISDLVMQEASAGDSTAAQDRLKVLATMTLVEVTETAKALARKFIEAGALPVKAANDALHIAAAVTNGVDYFVTWNCRHIANATLLPEIEACCIDAGFRPVRVCTPEQLLGGE